MTLEEIPSKMGAPAQDDESIITIEPRRQTEDDLQVAGSSPVGSQDKEHIEKDYSNSGKTDSEAVEEWFQMMRNSNLGFQSLEKKVESVIKAYQFDCKDALEDIFGLLSQEMSRLDSMEKSLGERLPPDVKAGMNQTPTRFSIPEIRYLPWLEAASILTPPDKRYALEIPFKEPSVSEVQLMALNDWKYHSSRSVETTDYIPATSLPERIRINSKRLQNFVDFEFCKGQLAYTDMTPLCILRPFKLLIYHDKAIRSRLADFEATRKRLQDWSEEEYIQDLQENPVKDHDQNRYGGIAEKTMSVTELTALIMDCRCLTKFMDETLRPAQEHFAGTPDRVRFVDLWFLFPQDSVIYSKDTYLPQKTWKVAQRTGGRRILGKTEDSDEKNIGSWATFKLDCYYMDYNGSEFISIYRQFCIPGFEGTQAVKALPVIPLSVAEGDGLVNRAYLKARGEQFLECTRKVQHLDYSGRCHYLTPTGKKLTELVDEIPKSVSCYSEQIDSDVIVDYSRALNEIPWWRPMTDNDNLGKTEDVEIGRSTAIDNDGLWDEKFFEDYMMAMTRKDELWIKTGEGPTGDDLIILPDRVFAFVLSTRRWACLQIGLGTDGVEKLRKREPKDNPWLKLRLPDGHKELVQSLINSHFARRKIGGVHFDLLRNKGNGVTILLHGVPGVGKTSTAECAAISNGRPLLPVTCGDLGLTAGEVEEKLKEIFRLAQEWGCIMLLDEADVFLAQRRAYDVERNALVSVFLRTLEYYEGILFLTTNRVGVFDEAFKSRIHMSLYYPPLDWLQTYEIWAGHIDEANNSGILADKGELTSFANQIYSAQLKPGSGPVWNGRQIRNAFQSALALAAFYSKEGEVIQLTTTYFFKVFTVSDKFSKYIWATQNQQDDADRNRQAMVRRDDYPVNQPGMTGVNPYSPQQASTLQPPYTQGSQFMVPPPGHQNPQPSGGLASGQTYMGDPLNPTGMPTSSASLSHQTPSPQMLQSQFGSQLGIPPASVPLGQQSGQFQHRQPSPQTLQSQLNMLNINANSHTLQRFQQSQDRLTSQPEGMAESQSLLQPLDQAANLAYPSHTSTHSLPQLQHNAGQLPPLGKVPPILQ